MTYKQTLIKFLALFLFSYTFTNTSLAQFNYEIAKWKDWKTSATVITFDDWSVGHPTRAIPELNSRGLPASFYVNGWSFDLFQDEIEDAVEDGHEIGNHSATHGELLTMDLSEIEFQIEDFKDEIDSKLPNQVVRTIAYPFGDGGGLTDKDEQIRSVAARSHIAARRVANSSLAFDEVAENYYRLPAFLVRGNTNQSEFTEWFFTGLTDDHLRIFIFHGIGKDDNGFEPISEAQFNVFLNTISSNIDKTWVGTFDEVIRYHREASTAQLVKIAPLRTNYQRFRLLDEHVRGDAVDIYNLPLNVKLEDSVGIEVNYIIDSEGNAIPFEKKDGYIYFQKVPDEKDFFVASEPVNGYQAPQTIDFPVIMNMDGREDPFTPPATSTSGLPVSFSVISGPANSDGTTITLTGGEGLVTIQADQAGSEQFLAADPVQQTFEVLRRKDQIISFDSIPRKLTFDDPFDIVASSNSGLPVLVELVSGPATIDSATNRIVTLTGEPGTVVLRAIQEGNEEFWKADPVERTFEVLAKQPQTITFNTLPDIIASSEPFTLEATSSSGLGIVYAVDSGPATVDGNLLSLTGEVGKVTVRATQPGDENFLAADDVSVSFRAFKLEQTITFDSIPDQFTTSRPIAPTAMASSDLAVSFSVVSGGAVFVGDSLILPSQVGTIVLEANQEGDESYLAAEPVQRSFQILKTPQTVTLDSVPDFYVDAQPFRVTATATSGLSIIFRIKSGPAFITDGNQVNLTGFAGDVVVEATQSGDDVWAPAKDEQLFEIVPTPPVSVKEFTDQLTGLKLYPNPASSEIFVEFDSRSSEKLNVGIYNMHGQGIFAKEVSQPGKNLLRLDVSDLASGVYYLKINSSQLLGSGTFMVK